MRFEFCGLNPRRYLEKTASAGKWFEGVTFLPGCSGFGLLPSRLESRSHKSTPILGCMVEGVGRIVRRLWGRRRGRFALAAPITSESGSIMVLGLVLLLLLSLLCIHSADVCTTEIRIAANYRLATEAFYAAESGLEEARMRFQSMLPEAPPRQTDWRLFMGSVQLAAVPDIARQLSNYDSDQLIASSQDIQNYLVQIRHKTEADAGLDLCDDDLAMEDVRYWGDIDGDGVFEENPITCGGDKAGQPIEILTCWGVEGFRPSGQALLRESFVPEWMGPPLAFAAGSNATVETVKRISSEMVREPLPYALFGDSEVLLESDGAVRVAGGVGDLAHLGSNASIEARASIEIWGRGDLGRQPDGSPAQLTQSANPPATFHGGIHDAHRIDPDPLGILGGHLASLMEKVEMENDNFMGANPAIIDPVIMLTAEQGGASALSLTAGDYFFTSINIGKQCTLTLDNATAPVRIFLTGRLDIQEEAKIVTSGPPAHLIFYSSSEDPMNIHMSGTLSACIYAPLADVEITGTGDFQGMIWAQKVKLKNSGDLIYDPTLRNIFIGRRNHLTAWYDR